MFEGFTPRNVTIVTAIVALAVFGYMLARSGGVNAKSVAPSVIPGPKVFTLEVKDRKLVSGTSELEAVEGDPVTISIVVDEDEELHLHGYDRAVDLTKDVPATLTLVANVSGRFPFELEHSKTELGTLNVYPK